MDQRLSNPLGSIVELHLFYLVLATDNVEKKPLRGGLF